MIHCFSLDGKYILTGGEDDLVQVWSMEDKKIVAWGEGHNSWVRFWSNVAQAFFPINYSGYTNKCISRLVELLSIHIGQPQIPKEQKKMWCIVLALLVR